MIPLTNAKLEIGRDGDLPIIALKEDVAMRTFDLSPLYRSTVGFDRLFNLLDEGAPAGAGYPPYNIERVAENDYAITMAVAGFAEEDISIEVKENGLLVSGAKTESDEAETREFLHRGIATRSFERRFQLADHVEVKGARLENGLLTIELERVIPEALKPRRIEIQNGSKAKVIENKAA